MSEPRNNIPVPPVWQPTRGTGYEHHTHKEVLLPVKEPELCGYSEDFPEVMPGGGEL